MNKMDFSKIDVANLHQSKKMVGGAAVAGIVGSFLPWATLPIVGSVSGTRIGGWITLIAFAIMLGLMLEGDSKGKISGRNLKASIGLGILSAVIVLIKIVDVFNAKSAASGADALFGDLAGGFKVSVGIGLWITLAAVVVSMFFLVKDLKSKKSTVSK